MHKSMIIICRIYVAVVAISCGTAAGLAYAAPNEEEVKFVAKDGMAFDIFGASVAISGSKAVVGSERGVYFFKRNGPKWLQQGRFDTVGLGRWAVAIDGNTAIVSGTHSAVVFQLEGTEWIKKGSLEAPPGATVTFGRSLAISGDNLIIGDFQANNREGAAYIFVRNGSEWTLQTSLKPNVRRPEGQGLGLAFGASVGISGDTAIVGAPTDNVIGDTVNQEGSAYVYTRKAGHWDGNEQGYLTADTENSSYFGSSVAISGNKAVVGSGSGTTGNAAFVFELNSSGWSPPRFLRTKDAETGDLFGESVAISGERIVVGASGSNNFQGAAYVFERGDGTWPQKQKLRASDPTSPNPPPPQGDGQVEAAFGSEVAISGHTIIISASAKKVGNHRLQGKAYVFQEPDADGDGLPDEWEKNGVWFEGVFLDLKQMGANPKHKDIFIHADWMLNPNTSGAFPLPLHPNPESLKKIIDAFAIAPVTNPDKKIGITLHIDLGPDSIMDPVSGKKWGDNSKVLEPVPLEETTGSATAAGVYSWDAVDAHKNRNFKPSKREPVFYYVLFGSKLPEAVGALGMSRGYPGSDMVLAGDEIREMLQEAEPDLAKNFNNEPFNRLWYHWIARTFMHELGHSLGLLHGGDEHIDAKPNYLSVVNTKYLTGIPHLNKNTVRLKYDYSRTKLRELNEDHLIEALGIGVPGYLVRHNDFPNENLARAANKCLGDRPPVLRSLAVDWDCNGKVTPNPVKADINGDSVCVKPRPPAELKTVADAADILHEGIIYAGADRICSTAAKTDNAGKPLDIQYTSVNHKAAPLVLTGFNDWKALDYSAGGVRGQQLAAVTQLPMITRSLEPPLETIMDLIPPGLIKTLLVEPRDLVTVSPVEGEPPLTVTFDGSPSTAFDGKIVKWEWDFGDGGTGSGATVTHTYTRPGDYFASLTVTDDKGRVNTTPLLNRVNVAGEIQLMPGDLNGDNVVDLIDLDIITAELNTPITEPSDPKDLNGDGTIDALDARLLVNLCTYPRCASSK
jgi:hypothetical protein